MTDQTTPQDPTTQHPDPDAQSAEQIAHPGHTEDMQQEPDHGEESYRGSGRLEGRRALITGGDSGIGRAVAIAFAREGADVAISYLPEEEDDARETLRWVEQFGADTPLGRAGQPAELAPAYVFLASQESSYVTGDRILVTGGRS